MCHNVFIVWPKTTLLLPVWPRDAGRWDSPGRSGLISSLERCPADPAVWGRLSPVGGLQTHGLHPLLLLTGAPNSLAAPPLWMLASGAASVLKSELHSLWVACCSTTRIPRCIEEGAWCTEQASPTVRSPTGQRHGSAVLHQEF